MRRQHSTSATFVGRCRLSEGSAPWAFAASHANEIERYWVQCVGKNPHFFNGVVFVMARYRVINDVFEAAFYRSDFKSFLYWRDHGYPPAIAFDAFGSAIVLSQEGHVLLGQQSVGHINAGKSYLPGGFIDQRDCNGAGVIDIVGSVTRELTEETGLGADIVTVRPGFVVVETGNQVAICVVFQAARKAVPLQGRIEAFLSVELQPELAGVIFVGPESDLSAIDVPEYTRLALAHLFRERGAA